MTRFALLLVLATALLGAQVGARGLHSHSRNLAKRSINDKATLDMLYILYDMLNSDAAKHLMWTISGSNQGYVDGCKVVKEMDPTTFDMHPSEQIILQYFCDLPASYAESYRSYLLLVEEAEE